MNTRLTTSTYVFPVQSTIARGRVVSIDTSAARALPGVIAVLSHENAPQLAPVNDAKLAVFQSEAIAYRGQFVAAVVAETLEMARQPAELVVVRYEEQPHDVELRADLQILTNRRLSILSTRATRLAVMSRPRLHRLPSRSTTSIRHQPSTPIRSNPTRRLLCGTRTASPSTMPTRARTRSGIPWPRPSNCCPNGCASSRICRRRVRLQG